MTLLGGFSYIKNIILTRNPFFPAEVQICGFTVFKGIYGADYFKSNFYYSGFSWKEALTHPGFGILGFIVIALGIVMTLFMCLRGKSGRATSAQHYYHIFLALLPILTLSIFYFLIPYRSYRFLFVPIVSGYLVLGLLNHRLKALSWILGIALIPDMSISIYKILNISRDTIIHGLLLVIAIVLIFILHFYIHASSFRHCLQEHKRDHYCIPRRTMGRFRLSRSMLF